MAAFGAFVAWQSYVTGMQPVFTIVVAFNVILSLSLALRTKSGRARQEEARKQGEVIAGKPVLVKAAYHGVVLLLNCLALVTFALAVWIGVSIALRGW